MSKAIDYGKSLIGIPYGKWNGGNLSPGEPMWAENKPPPPSISSVSCAGLCNLILRYLGISLPYSQDGGLGGTLAYYQYYHSKNMVTPFDPEEEYPVGTLIGRKYRNIEDQGHVAIILQDNMVLQSFLGGGVNANYTLEESHAGWYYEYTVAPEHWLS